MPTEISSIWFAVGLSLNVCALNYVAIWIKPTESLRQHPMRS